ncbi:inner centromere protein isoform X1 [Rousettus aegyptiacus]|uniref:Inner centromere protein n=1 Tax=Rousettus aegyptiacus TaxID=9407 RepID=A0A7J8GZQ5_ROUAE|nr:inner centromere protein isoform X1 [Rousettus aegyptiacus]XP_015983398.2 inner centromere protein isoform X1 [Rousettus aegyptiacus]XP_036076985.1 inner centromere protein isoform X1 [Rousettus aegyptiacus]KAF6465544.1 inner centromere protein [Rousettus aegyptiacus]
MGTTAPGPIHLLELCDQKLLEFVCNVDNKDLVWLEEIEEEAERMFTREFSKEPELMPKTPSQKNRRKKKRISYVQDENRDPIRKRLSRRRTRSSQLSSRHLRSKDKVEQLATAVGESGSVLRRVTRAAAAAAAATTAAALPTPESPTALTKKPQNSVAQGPLVPMVEIGASERCSAELHLSQLKAARAPSPTPAPATAPAPHIASGSDEECLTSTPKKSESVAVSSLMTTPQDPKGRGVGAGRSASKLRIARTSPGLQGSPGSPASPWRERVLAPILPDNCSTPTGSRAAPQSTRHSPIAPSSPGPQASLSQKASLVAKTEDTVRRSSRRIAKKATKEQAPSARIICHSYLERLLNIEVPQKVSPKQKEPTEEAESVEVAEREVPKNDGNTLWSHSATKIAISTPGSRPGAGGQEIPSEGQQEAKNDQAGDPKEPPQSVRRKRSYKQAVSELDEEQQLEEEGEELQPPRSKTPSPPCPASKVVRPLRTFLHTVQRNQMLMTPTSASRSSVMKSFIKRNTPLRVDPKCSFVEKERQRLENLRRKEEAEQLRRQKVEEDKRRRLEEVKLKREERLRKVLQARERVEQMKEEKKKQIEQKFAQLDEKTEKAKEERLAEEKAKKKAAAKKMEEAEVRRKQEEEARRLRWLQQEEEERRHQELLQKKKEEEQERLRKAAEARRLAEQREQERQLAEQERRREQERLQAERELQEREKALRLQREKLQRELEEKKKKEEQQRLAEQQRLQEEQKKATEAAAASKSLNVTVDVQSPACTSYQMTPQGHRAPPKINPDNYGMDLNSDDSTDDEAHPRKPIPSWARGTQLSQAIIHQYYHPPNLLELFGTILQLDLEDIFKKSKPRYHKRTSSAVWNSPPLQGPRVPGSLAYSLKKH